MSHWNLKRAARLGYLAKRGLSVESIMADHVIAARSERAVRCAASRWGLAKKIKLSKVLSIAGIASPGGAGYDFLSKQLRVGWP